jgi:hypothetical protein
LMGSQNPFIDLENGFSLSTALLFANLSNLAYEKFELDQGKSLDASLKNIKFNLLKTFNDPATSTQAYLARNEKYAVLSFRGTDPNLIDILTDLKFRLDLKSGIHEGFFAAYESVKDQIHSAIDGLNGLPLYLTGHSLGGALATVTALDLKGKGIVECYTYGAPPICEAKDCALVTIPVYQVIDVEDIVPRIMAIGPILSIFVILLLNIGRKILRRWRAGDVLLDQYISGLLALTPDLGKYAYFPDPYWIGDDGKAHWLERAGQSISIFWKIFSKDWRRCLTDHMIANYIDRLKAENTQNSDS